MEPRWNVYKFCTSRQSFEYQTTALVEIVDGHVIPEFGVIAVMILAVAIVSIIVVTAKTRLSIVPRY